MKPVYRIEDWNVADTFGHRLYGKIYGNPDVREGALGVTSRIIDFHEDPPESKPKTRSTSSALSCEQSQRVTGEKQGPREYLLRSWRPSSPERAVIRSTEERAMSRQRNSFKIAIGLSLAAGICGCGGSPVRTETKDNVTSSNPIPTITTISPNSAMAGGAPFTLRILGTNFVAASTVNFGGTAGTNTTVSPTQLWVAIPASAIASAGIAAVIVTNPGPGGGTSKCGELHHRQRKLSHPHNE